MNDFYPRINSSLENVKVNITKKKLTDLAKKLNIKGCSNKNLTDTYMYLLEKIYSKRITEIVKCLNILYEELFNKYLALKQDHPDVYYIVYNIFYDDLYFLRVFMKKINSKSNHKLSNHKYHKYYKIYKDHFECDPIYYGCDPDYYDDVY